MPGMNSGVNVNDPTVIAAFKSALLHQGIIALLIFGLLGLVWIAVRARQPEAAQANGQAGTVGPGSATVAEPTWRQVLRIGFGLLWVFDGILQAQPKMAIGLPSQVIQPAAASSPHWVQHVVNWAGTTWSYHPMQAGAASVWIQIGIGVWLLAAPRGSWSRLAGLASVGWGLVVWVFGESFGGVFAPGLTWLFGAPGAVLIYCVAGALIALPERVWHDPPAGRAILSGLGLFLVGMAVLQAWPGRGFWQGISHGQPGTLAGMTGSMAQTPQPGFLSALVNSLHRLRRGPRVRGQPVCGDGARPDRCRLPDRPAGGWPARQVIAFTVLCLADWVLIEDLGFFGGLGTDPNSMIPIALLAVSGYLALTPETVPVVAPAARRSRRSRAWWRSRQPGGACGRLARPGPAGSLRRSVAAASFPTIVSLGALGLIILGAAPMAVAQASRNADPILAESIAGSSAPLNFPAKGFALTDQHGQPVSLASLRGKVVLLTFLDPVCTTDCPLIAQEFRAAGQLLGPASRKVELVAVVANPVYHQVTDTQAFDRAEQLNQVPNWLYLTGSVPQLQQVWKDYGISAEILPAGSMIGHQDIAYVIDQAGQVRAELDTDPGPGDHRHQVLVRGPARQRRPASAEVVMSRRRQASLLLAVTMLSAGCASAARQASTSAAATEPPSLATSLVTTTGTWAVAVMGGPAAQHNNFWQLFVRPAATGKWRLATPPGVASNGGLVVASLGAGSVVAGFRPSQELSYSPLATSHDDGTGWTPGVLDAALAESPTPWPPLPAAPTCSRCSQAAAPSCPGPAGPAGRDWLPARPSPPPPRAASAGRLASPPQRSAQPGLPCWQPAAPTPGQSASSPTPAGRGNWPGPRSPRRTHTRTSPSFGSPPRPAPPWRCWRPPTDRRHNC